MKANRSRAQLQGPVRHTHTSEPSNLPVSAYKLMKTDVVRLKFGSYLCWQASVKKIYMLRWRNWELRHAGVQDRAPKVCPEQETQAEQGSSLNARNKTRRKRQPKPSIRRVDENKSPPPPPRIRTKSRSTANENEREKEEPFGKPGIPNKP